MAQELAGEKLIERSIYIYMVSQKHCIWQGFLSMFPYLPLQALLFPHGLRRLFSLP